MTEFVRVRQDKTGFKRLFEDDRFDLYVWYTKRGGRITRFQLVYDKWTNPKAFTWIRGRGYQHNRIHGYDGSGYLNPILVADGLFDAECIVNEFLKHSNGVDEEIVQLVFHTITTYYPARDDQST